MVEVVEIVIAAVWFGTMTAGIVLFPFPKREKSKGNK